MEITGNYSSDRDKKMKESFDNLLEKDKDKKEKSEAKKPRLKLSLFEVARTEQDETEKDKSFFDFLKPDETNEKEPEPGSLEHLDDEETEHIVAEYIDTRVEEVSEEREAIPDTDPESIASSDANIAFLENLREANEARGVNSEEELDEILGTTIDELDLTPPETFDENDEDEETVAPAMPPLVAPASSDVTPTPPEKVVVVENRKKQAANLLIGGAVGYLIGRRRGRIKTEKRMMPIQEKLEQHVKDLHSKIAVREEKIRTLAAEKVRAAPLAKREVLEERIETEEVKKPPTPVSLRIEKLAKVIIPPVERAAEKPETKEVKRAEELSVPALLRVAKNLEFQGTTVDQLYERGQIDSLGLRRAVSEYLAGRRFEAVLVENLRRYDSPEHLQTNVAHSSSTGVVGVGGTYGATANISQENQTQTTATSSAYGVSGFGTAPKPQTQKLPLPPAYIVGAVILGLIIIAFLIL